MAKKFAYGATQFSLCWLLICFCYNPVIAQSGQKAGPAKEISAAQDKYAWFNTPGVSREEVTSWLNVITGASQSAAASEATSLRAAKTAASAEGQRAAGLLLGAALEQAGD